MGLPIHRLDGSPKARVFAYPAELDRWLDEKLHEHDRDPRPNGKKGRATLPTLPAWNIGLIAGLAVLAIAAIGTSAWLIARQSRIRWANDVAIPEIERLLLTSENQRVFDLAMRSEEIIPHSPRLPNSCPRSRPPFRSRPIRRAHRSSSSLTPGGAKAGFLSLSRRSPAIGSPKAIGV